VEALRYQDFVRVFNEDPRLKHIFVARKRDNFGVCTICTQYKQNLANHRLTETKREGFLHDFRSHMCGVAKDRAAMVARMAETKVLQPTEPGEKPILDGAVVMVIGKMTKKTTEIPSCKPMPK
jgi:hypothetical protein